MSEESKRLRKSAADQLRQSRRSKSASEKASRAGRAAALKEMASNEEWLEGDKPRSRKRSPKR
jgi:hypothetical protein